MLLLLWPKYDDVDTHDGHIDYSRYGRKWHEEQDRQPKKRPIPQSAPVEELPPDISDPIATDAELKRAQAQLAELYQRLSEVSAGLDGLEAQRQLLTRLEAQIRDYFEREAELRREEEELLVMLLLN